MGWCEAAAKFDAARGIKFSTFAMPYVMRHLTDMKQDESTAPHHAQDYVARLVRQGNRRAVEAKSVTDEDREQAKTLRMHPETVCRQRREIAAGVDRAVSAEDTAVSSQTNGANVEAVWSFTHADMAQADEPDMAESVGDRLDVAEALSTLPEESRRLVHMRLFEGQTRREISEALCLPERTIKQRLSEAYGRLRPLLQHLVT